MTEFFDPGAQAALMQEGTRQKVRRGDALVRAGTPADTLFFVLSGRFHVIAGGKVIAEIADQQPLGEIAFFTGETRTADVLAARDSEVVALNRDAWGRVALQQGVADAVIRSLAHRLEAAVPHVPRMAPIAPQVTVLVPSGGAHIPEDVAQGLARALTGLPPVRAADMPSGDAESISTALTAREVAGQNMTLWIEGTDHDTFADAALRQSDAVIFVASAGGDARLSPVEADALRLHRHEARHLILLRAHDAPITGTAPWLAARDPQMHHHAATDADLARAARLIAGKGLGLVLSGGGALSCTHVGIARAMREAGIEIDYYAGTSGGAAMSIALAAGRSPQEILSLSQEIFVRSGALRKLTLPIHSVLDHHPFDARLREHYGPYQLEDLPIPVIAVSTSLTHNAPYLHQTGPAWEAVRASSSLPGLLPPVITDDGEVLIDGGIIDNAPIGPLQQIKLGPNIVVSLRPQNEWRISARYSDLPARMQLARDLAMRRYDAADLPRLMQILQRSMVVTSRRTIAEASMEGNLLVTPNLPEHLGLMDWHAGAELEAIGHAHMTALIEEGAVADLAAP